MIFPAGLIAKPSDQALFRESREGSAVILIPTRLFQT